MHAAEIVYGPDLTIIPYQNVVVKTNNNYCCLFQKKKCWGDFDQWGAILLNVGAILTVMDGGDFAVGEIWPGTGIPHMVRVVQSK